MNESTIRAKLKCHEVTKTADNQERVKLWAVYDPDPASENHSFAKATPSATLEITIDNPAAQGFFVPGRDYYLDFSPADLTNTELAALAPTA
ncbi:MAG: hypothetical protein JO295_13595 [Verrucomicrobia bacterium]|nr:hypothetical protein [Verrucomicrobiota bacterium]